jgi:hypothetical protein
MAKDAGSRTSQGGLTSHASLEGPCSREVWFGSTHTDLFCMALPCLYGLVLWVYVPSTALSQLLMLSGPSLVLCLQTVP